MGTQAPIITPDDKALLSRTPPTELIEALSPSKEWNKLGCEGLQLPILHTPCE
jgi:hypothetical protein